MKIRVAIIDDSPLIRQLLKDILESAPDIEVVALGRNGEDAITIAAEVRPDVMTLDVEMPRMSGLDALRGIMAKTPMPVLMVSTLTHRGAATALECLDIGAYDVIGKPMNGSFTAIRQIQDDLLAKVRMAKEAKIACVRKPLLGSTTPAPAKPTALPPTLVKSDRVVVIASSTGGPKALGTLWANLPKAFPAPIVIVQHMPAGFTESLAARLDRIGTVSCREAAMGDSLQPGQALVAPGGFHLRMIRNGQIKLDEEPSIHGVRPAADYLFESAAEVFGRKVIGVILTGMGRDGAEGAVKIKAAGGTVFTEHESTCTIYGMPRAAVQAGASDMQVPIQDMAMAITAALAGRKTHAA